MELDISNFVREGDTVYSPVCGPAYVYSISKNIKAVCVAITIKSLNGECFKFYPNGQLHVDGNCLLFPSKDDKDWNSFKRREVVYEYEFEISDPETVYWYRVTNNKRWNEVLHNKLVELTGKKNLMFPIESEGMIFFSEKEGLNCFIAENKMARMAMMVGKEIKIKSEMSYV